MSGEIQEDDSYFQVTRRNLLRDLEDNSRVRALAETVAPLKVERVLDVGCGIGQALFPLALSKGALGVGADISAAGCRMGREFYAEHLPDARVVFVRSRAEQLPFTSQSFDVVNCGLALPYTDNARAIAEISRVLRPGGLFLLKIHHARYYLRELRGALGSLRPLSVLYAGRVLATGTLYHLLRRQPRTRLLNESFQTRWLLRRELEKQGLEIAREQSNSNPLTPAFVIYTKR
jgi:ubiquinone/menaquinone biosynthesis C-methylase UbiE